MQMIISLVVNAAALLLTAYLVPGFHVVSFTTALLAAIVLAVVNTFIKPVLSFLTAPLNVLTLGLFSFVINAIVLWIVSAVVRGLTIDNFVAALLAAVVLSVISTALSMLLKDVAPAARKA